MCRYHASTLPYNIRGLSSVDFGVCRGSHSQVPYRQQDVQERFLPLPLWGESSHKLSVHNCVWLCPHYFWTQKLKFCAFFYIIRYWGFIVVFFSLLFSLGESCHVFQADLEFMILLNLQSAEIANVYHNIQLDFPVLN